MQRLEHPKVKPEQIDPAYLPPSYHQQQQQQQKQRQMAPQTNGFPPNHGAQSTPQSHTKKPEPPPQESQIDFQSIKGVFGWTVIDNVYVPYILRGDKEFVSVRIVELKLLSRYPNSYPDDLGKHAPLTSFFVTPNEAKLLNEINVQHCDSEYGKKEFVSKDLIVLLSDFIRFYELVKKTFPDAAAARAEQLAREAAGWLQIKNTVTPYVKRVDGKYVPLSVIQYAAGLLVNEKVSGLPPTPLECQMLNEACKKAGVEFVFSDTSTRLISLNDIQRNASVEIIELPSSNPLKHATYMELPTSNGRGSGSRENGQQPQQPSHTQQPKVPNSQSYVFQPTAQLDIMRSQIQSTVNTRGQNGQRFPTAPGVSMVDPRLMNDPRLRYGPPNISIGPNGTISTGLLPHPAMFMQGYVAMQRQLQQQQQAKPQPTIGATDARRSPASSNPSPRSRPPSQTRPPSGPSDPLSPGPLSPLSQAPPSYQEHIQHTRMTHMNGPALQQMQTMMHRFPTPNNQFGQSEPHHTTGPRTPLSPGAQSQRQPSANQELPGLFTPTGTSINAKSNHDMARAPVVFFSTVGSVSSIASSVNVTANSEHVPKVQAVPQPQSLVPNVMPPKPLEDLTQCIRGAWLNNKSISCLFVEKGSRAGQYCLVEAVCKLYFNGCRVKEFLFALENVLNVPLTNCTDAEERAFIQYYSLPVQELKCNKMITFKDLEKYFPQLSYMFPSKEAIAQSEKDGSENIIMDSEGLDFVANGAIEESNGALDGTGHPPAKRARLTDGVHALFFI